MLSWLLCLPCLVLASCAPRRAESPGRAALEGAWRVSTTADGATWATLDDADGSDAFELPSGDLLVAGVAGGRGFVQRLSREGRVRWTAIASDCLSPRVAAVDDDTLYVATEGSLAVGAAPAAAGGRAPGGCGLKWSAPTAIARMDGRGAVRWRVEIPGPTSLVASRDRIVTTHVGMTADGAGETEIASLTPDGVIEWTRTEKGGVYDAALSASGRAVVAAGPSTADRSPCLLRAFAAASGHPLWQSYVVAGPVVADLHYTADRGCTLEGLRLTTRGGVVLTREMLGWLFVAFDPDTGIMEARRVVGSFDSAGSGMDRASGRGEPPVFWVYPPSANDERVSLVTAQPQTAEPARFAEIPEPERGLPEGYTVLMGNLRWGHDALIGVGSLSSPRGAPGRLFVLRVPIAR
jgi:hypothetical protein